MKTQLSKPTRDKARYTDEYKEQALALWRASGRSAAKIAAELGIRPPLLYRWARTERPGNTSPPGQKRLRSVEELEAEIRRLREENAKLLEQREVLKKSLGILSEVPPRGMPGSSSAPRCAWRYSSGVPEKLSSSTLTAACSLPARLTGSSSSSTVWSLP